MIELSNGQKFRSVRHLKKGMVFRTNRNGRMTYSRWFLALSNPQFKKPFLGYGWKVWSIRAEGYVNHVLNHANCRCVLSGF